MTDRCVREAACCITAGDLARWLSVDLKTIHNWVRRGYLVGRRTLGGHRRFYRTEVVRFIRQAGWFVPAELSEPDPRVALIGDLSTLPESVWEELRAARLAVHHLPNPFQAIVQIAEGEFEIAVVGFGDHLQPVIQQFTAALREHPLTQGVVAVGVSRSAAARRDFVALGNDIAIGQEGALAQTILWLTATGPRPANLENAEHAPKLRRAGNQLRLACTTNDLSAPLEPTT
jgi:excisionase family DNA binding protein